MSKKKVMTGIVTIVASCVLVLGACNSEDSTTKQRTKKSRQAMIITANQFFG
ncbi:hypothetical protein HCB21_08410 [Listeria booriae]|uniref:hypothetical protein n=1 Tax=Listeria booriae TaxID=1552123 RepID=UPI0016280192|nr:hypothetical protein [Listeria booriae]MBC2159786.1 hypothetical protein [Listeria booriae]MBC2162116.1 hypothetical protein [Listeria booriae]MBC2170257.1 hypothetical protein [Listeria booriae]MBC2195350.1 hypothetical protein [Listeria booriae]